jgi:glycosyltransferase 2 family protein
MRKFIVAVILMLGIIFLLTSFGEVEKTVQILQKGKLGFIALAIGLDFAWMTIQAVSYQKLYSILGLEHNRRGLFVVTTAAFFTNVAAPTAGASAVAVFMSDARRRGYSTARVMVAWTMFILLDYLGFLAFILVGMAVLVRRNNLQWTEITAYIVLFIGAAGLGTLLYLGMRSATLLARVLAWLARAVNWITRPFIKREYLSPDRAYTFATEAADGLYEFHQNPRGLLPSVLLTLAAKGVLLAILWLIFLAFDVPYSPGTLVAGFSIGYLFIIVSPTPNGVGIVEGVLALALNSLRVELAAATVITVAFRGVTFWLPLLVGMISFRRFSAAGEPASPPQLTPD